MSGLTGFSMAAELALMVVGPAVDVKLVAMQAGTLGRRFAARFAPDPDRPTARITATAPIVAITPPADTYELP